MTDTLERALERIATLHGPDRAHDEEIENFHEWEIEEIPPCADADDYGCRGHFETIKVCGECGTATHPEFDVWYFPWPCPTYREAAEALGRAVPA